MRLGLQGCTLINFGKYQIDYKIVFHWKIQVFLLDRGHVIWRIRSPPLTPTNFTSPSIDGSTALPLASLERAGHQSKWKIQWSKWIDQY